MAAESKERKCGHFFVAVPPSSPDEVPASLFPPSAQDKDFNRSLPPLRVSSRHVAYPPSAPGTASSRSLPHSASALGGTPASLFNVAVPPVNPADAQQLIFAVQDTELSSLWPSDPSSRCSSSRSTKCVSRFRGCIF
jgi:hypothetical protein